MSIKSVLTLLDNTQRCQAWSQFAIDFARRHDAHLLGVAPREIASSLMLGEMVPFDSSWISKLQKQIDSDVAAACDNFEKLCRAHGFSAAESRIEDGSDVTVLRHESPTSDLIILGQHSDHDDADNNRSGLIESLLMSSARPLLVVPAIGEYAPTCERVLIGWKNSREAAMAVRQSIPLLKQAQQVDIVTVDKRSHGDADDRRTRGLVSYLARHGIEAGVRNIVSELDAGNVLLSHACDSGADLLVIGGYGHARLTEWALGGVTRTIMQSMTLPVFVAH
jgi:nucleotide-binding universal stress UspA family protein